MPTVIVLDVSLSMSRADVNQDVEPVSRHSIAVQGINSFLDSLAVFSKLEFISLVAFSSLYEVVCGFTRDYEVIKNKLLTIDGFDKTGIETALHAVNNLVLEEWGNNIPCQILFITDGNIGSSLSSLKTSLNNVNNKQDPPSSFPLPFLFPAEMHILAIASPDDPDLKLSRSIYQKLIDLANNEGSLIVPENELSQNSVNNMFKKFAEDVYSFKGVLRCGNLNSNFILSPAPMTHTIVTDFESKKMIISKTIEICGFINTSDIGSPPGISRHLILPINDLNTKENDLPDAFNLTPVNGKAPGTDVPAVEPIPTPPENVDPDDEGKSPSFCVLLHGALKVENCVALVTVGESWFGYIYSYADSKKKSNLMLTVLHPGSNAIPWFGDLNNLGISDFLDAGETPGTFPVKPADKRSYSQNLVVWIKTAGLQADIQKILRHARKLPDKTAHFYKELNRLRKAAMSFGFIELLEGLAFIFERECTLLPGGTNPDCALQLTHAANELRKHGTRDMKFNITPLITQFNSASTSKNF